MDIEAADFEPDACTPPLAGLRLPAGLPPSKADLAPPASPAGGSHHPPPPPLHRLGSSQRSSRSTSGESQTSATRTAATVQELARRSVRSSSTPTSSAAPSVASSATEAPRTEVDLSGWSVARVAELSPQQRSALGRHCLRLTLPSGSSADTVRQWLRACPKLRAITALAIHEDGALISATRALDLREFKTTPPGPSRLCLGLDARLVVSDEWAVPPDRSRLRGWIANPDTLPRLSPEAFARVERLLRSLLFDSASAVRSGLQPGPGLRRTMESLMEASPPELMWGAAARNHAAVLDFVRRQHTIHYQEFQNFVRPTLQACWDTVVRPREPRGFELRPPEELHKLAALRVWRLHETPEESVGTRERVVQAAILAGLRDPQAIAHLLNRSSPERDDETLASPPVSEVTSPVVSPVSSPVTSPVDAPMTPPQFMPMTSSGGPELVASLGPPGTAGSGRGWR
ncbi:hypothetical protein [Roseateles terrae]|uniref:Uncharacterized protein n=1 Tax=Roseateles terrae TaxID=431060 RepID=A0ABR6GWI4_9BURK|nr:hypothetical protein [Roseateles terrae]MBB3196461.1 hypothetical protein [Roseateles terrae]OWQ83325.1 hypothetical protein CDN98_23090 [Roseateles terrae]